MQNTAKIFVLRLLFSILMICFFSGFTSQYRYLMKLQHQVDLETEGKYKELLEEYMEDLKSAREKQNRYPQISKLKQIGQVYLQKLKDYSQAVTYSEQALKLIQEGQTEDRVNESDSNFGIDPNIRKRGLWNDLQLKKHKLWLYEMAEYEVLENLTSVYKAMGDFKKAAFYQQRRDKFWESASQATKNYYQALGPSEKDKQLILTRMKYQASIADLQGLRASIEEYGNLQTKHLFKPPKENVIQNAYIDELQYISSAEEAYNYGLYQEALEFSRKVMEAVRIKLQSMLKIYSVKEQSIPDKPFLLWEMFCSRSKTLCANHNASHQNQVNASFIAGKSLNRLGRNQEAIQYLQDVIDEYESGRVIFSRSDLDSKLIQKIDSLDELAYAFQKLGIKQKAVEALAELINYFEEIRAKLTKESQKISYMGTRNEVYDRIIELLLSQGRASEALDYVERARARAFIDILGDKELKAKSQKVQELLTKKKSAETRYYGLLQEISGDVASRERSIQIVQKEMDGVLKKTEKDDAELLSMTTVKTLKASEIQNLIDSDTAIAEYYVTRDGVLIWIVTSDSIQATKVEIPEWLLAKKVLEFRENVTNPGIRNRKEDLKEKISSVRLEITPARFKKDEEYSIRVYAQNNMSLFLSIDKMDTKIGEHVNTSVDMLEREIPGGEERLISEAKYVPTKFFSMNITPGVHQVILHTDQGKLASNILEVAVHENNLVTITDKGFDEEPKGVRADLYKYENMSLYDILIKPVNPHLTRKRLGIVPHGILHYLPFAALRHNDRFLIEDYSLVYFTSATVYKFCKNKSKELGGEILAFGNPDLGQPSLDIPFALKEVASISNLYPKSQVLVRAEASEEAFKSLSGSYNVLHLASHGTFNADQPLQSALLLSPSGKEDGKLTVSEIFEPGA